MTSSGDKVTAAGKFDHTIELCRAGDAHTRWMQRIEGCTSQRDQSCLVASD